jgi:hypothetical protein
LARACSLCLEKHKQLAKVEFCGLFCFKILLRSSKRKKGGVDFAALPSKKEF